MRTCELAGCGNPLPPHHRRWCSQDCYRDSERTRKRERARERYHSDPEYRAKMLAKRAAQYERDSTDPEKRERHLAYLRTYHAEHREEARGYHRAYRERRDADAAWRAGYLERERERMRRKRLEDPEHQRELERAYYQRVRSDPRRWAEVLERQRMYYRLRAMRAGEPIAPVPEHRYPEASTQWTMDAELLRRTVRRWMADEGPWGESEALLAERAGVSPRLLYRLLHEDGKVSIDAADRIAWAMGLHLELVA
jgi:hypothetical protein